MKINIRKFLIITLLCAQCFNCAFAEDSYDVQLKKIEQEVWGFSYDNESEQKRLERIEKQIFGTVDSKLSSDKRIEKINKSLGLESIEEAKSSISDLYVIEQAGEGAKYPQIDKLESTLLGSVYTSENIDKRLERLEKKAFGEKQKGELSQRTEALNNYMYANVPQGNFSSSSLYGDYQKQGSNPSYYADDADIKLQLSALENVVFATDFSTEPVHIRLNRLENKIFQRNFDDDDEQTRVSRIQAAATANRSAKYYDNNKFQKFTATGLQAASFLLMILAFIL